MAFTVYGYDGNPRTRIIKAIAATQEIKIDLIEAIPRQNINRDVLITLFPRSRGKIPILKGPEGLTLMEYLSKLKPSHLLGDGSLEQEAEVLSWVNWANQELLMTMSRWFLPLIPGLARPAVYSKAAVEAGKEATLAMLDIHEKMMRDRKGTWLVGEHMTLADLFVAVYLARGMEYVLDAEWRAAHPASLKHFEMVAQWKPMKEAGPDFRMVERETPNADPYNVETGTN